MEEQRQASAGDGDSSSELDALIELLGRLESEQRRDLLSASTALAPDAIASLDGLLEAGQRGAEVSRLLEPALGVAAAEQLLARLVELDRSGADRRRFRDGETLGRGGMGEVTSAFDAVLRREVALKTLRGDAVLRPGTNIGWVRRFVDEAQITAQLEHPAIPPVHDIGIDPEGRPFFAMQRVRGQSFGQVLGALASGEQLDGQRWTLQRAIDVLRRAGEAVAYAHSRGVVHRDLKPENVMVGEFGAVYVMDWGLARIFGDDEAARSEHAAPPALETDRADLVGAPHATRIGTVLGTLQYMPPEQALPGAAPAGPRADVYALGAILYRILAGHAPYGRTRGSGSQAELLEALRERPPAPLEEVAPDSPAELRAIAARAMARDPQQRYPSVAELVADLDAYLERRVVRAHRTGPVVEVAKWIERNRGLASISTVGTLMALLGFLGWQANAVRAEQSERRLELTERSRAMLELPAEVELLAEAARDLLPVHPRHEPQLLALRARAEALIGADRTLALIAELEAELAAQRPLASERAGARAIAARRAELVTLIRRSEQTFATVGVERFAPRFPAEVEAWRAELEQLPDLRADEPSAARSARAAAVERVLEAHALLSSLRAEQVPVAHPSLPTHETQLALIERMQAVQATDAARAAWAGARAVWSELGGPYATADVSLEFDPRLLPLGPDPESGLLEFAHLATGLAPERDAQGRLVLDAESAVVLVALPGGDLYVGAEPDGSRNVDPLAEPRDGPCRPVRLWSFLIGKHELTQAQFERLTGANPSAYAAGGPSPGGLAPIDGRHPIESVSWTDARRALAAIGLCLPTSSQWEYAGRGGTTTPWWPGDDPGALIDRANLLDRVALEQRGRPKSWDVSREFAESFEDPWPIHAPVGSLAANGFGLHDVHGNVAEWCEDAFHGYDGPDQAWLLHGRGEMAQFEQLEPSEADKLVARGGSFASTAAETRIAFRLSLPFDYLRENLGLRPALEFERPLD